MNDDTWSIYADWVMETFPDEIRCKDDYEEVIHSGIHEEEFYEAHPILQAIDICLGDEQ